MNERFGFQERNSTAVGRSLRGELHLPIELRHGGTPILTLRYELAGQSGGPLLIVAGGISAGRHVVASDEFPQTGWWDAQKRSFALERNRILAIDWIGADGELDVPIDPIDQADAISLILDELGVPRAAAFIGASYGGMVGMHFAQRHPDRIGALLAIGAAANSHPYSSACRSLQRQALLLGEAGGAPEAGVALARAMAMLTYRTPEEFGERFAEAPRIDRGRIRVGADDYLEAHGAKHRRRMSSTAYRRLSESIDLHQIDPAGIRVPLILAGVDKDALVPMASVEALAAAVPGARLHVVQSHYGHDAFLKEERQIAAIICEFLSYLEHDQ